MAQWIASGLVLFYAWNRFNTPPSVRTQTSLFQYYASGIFYMLACQGILLIFTWLVENQPEFIEFLHDDKMQISKDTKGIAAPLIAALIVTTFFPSVPVLRDIDGKILRFFHRMGAIPLSASLWVQRLRESPFIISNEIYENTVTFIHDSGELSDSLIAELQTNPEKDPTRFAFTRILVTYVSLIKLIGWTKFSTDFPEEAEQFKKRIKDFFAQATAYFGFQHQLVEGKMTVSNEIRNGFISSCRETYYEMLVMLSRALLYSSKNETQMAQRLVSLGFKIGLTRRRIFPTNLIALDLIAVILLFVGSAVIMNDRPIGNALIIGLLVSINHSIAAIFSILPKEFWSFASMTCSKTAERPYLAYLLSATMTVAITLTISYAFYLFRIKFMQSSGMIFPFPSQAKWLLLSAVLAFTLAFCCDNFLTNDNDPIWLKWIEAICVSIIMAVAGFTVRRWIISDANIPEIQLRERGPQFLRTIFLSASIGAVFGFTIPSWYRKTFRRLKEDEQAEQKVG